MGGDYQQYLEERHAGFETPDTLVYRMLRRAIGRAAHWRRKLVAGNDNEVYSVIAHSGREYVVRIKHGGEVNLAEEEWALAQARQAGVPVPRVYLVDALEEYGRRYEFMVQSRAPGRALSEVLPRLSEEQRAKVWRQAGAILGRLHTVQVGGFYHRYPDGEWDFASWAAVMDSTLRGRSSERERIVRAGFTEREFAEMLRLIARYRDEFDCPQPVLCHGDYLPEHIFVDDELQITAVLDFGMYRGDHPVCDFAYLALEGIAGLPHLLEGYPDKRLLGERFEDHLHLHRLTLEMGFLAHYLTLEGYPESELNTPGLRHTLDWLLQRGW